jgi:replicative DNA helicase
MQRIDEAVPPHDREAEICTLGSMILDREVIGDTLLILNPEDFYSSSHREIYERMISLYEKGSEIDLIILKDDFVRSEILERVGGMDYVISLAEAVPTSANAGHYARIVRDKSIQRRLISQATEIIREARSEPEDVKELLDSAEQKIFEIGEFGGETTTEHIHDLMKTTLQRIDSLQSMEHGRVTGLRTGFGDLDDMLDGLHPAELLIIAARPSMGKTSLALNIADNIAVREPNDKGVLVFSCEMSREQVAQNMLCANARIDGHKMRRGQLSDEDWQELPLAADRLSRAPIYIDDTPGLSLNGLRAKARRMLARHKEIKVLIVDYLQLLSVTGRIENRQIEITRISQGLKQLARELHVPIICLSQLNRSLETRTDKRPLMADLRESGSIEQDADVIIFIYRDERYNPTTVENENVAELIVAKQRNGPTGKLQFYFRQEFMRFLSKSTIEPRGSVSSEDVRL